MLQRPDNCQLYNVAAALWPRGPFVTVSVRDYPGKFRFPLAFLQPCDSSHAFLQQLVQPFVNEPGVLALAGIPVDLSTRAQAGSELEFLPADSSTAFTAGAAAHGASLACAGSSGPDGRYKARALGPSEPFDDSASLAPSQVSDLQVRRSPMRPTVSA